MDFGLWGRGWEGLGGGGGWRKEERGAVGSCLHLLEEDNVRYLYHRSSQLLLGTQQCGSLMLGMSLVGSWDLLLMSPRGSCSPGGTQRELGSIS